jgi:hypothetical protein
MAQPPVIRTTSKYEEIEASIKKLARVQVLVGIPQSNAARTGGGPSNALLGYVHENGEPSLNIPARPFLKPGIRDQQSAIVRYLRQAGKAAVEGDDTRMMNAFRAAGESGVKGATNKITTGPFTPLSPRTIAARLRRTQAGRTRLRRMRAAGQDVAAWAASNLKPLIDTGQLRRAITYVLRMR